MRYYDVSLSEMNGSRLLQLHSNVTPRAVMFDQVMNWAGSEKKYFIMFLDPGWGQKLVLLYNVRDLKTKGISPGRRGLIYQVT